MKNLLFLLPLFLFIGCTTNNPIVRPFDQAKAADTIIDCINNKTTYRYSTDPRLESTIIDKVLAVGFINGSTDKIEAGKIGKILISDKRRGTVVSVYRDTNKLFRKFIFSIDSDAQLFIDAISAWNKITVIK